MVCVAVGEKLFPDDLVTRTQLNGTATGGLVLVANGAQVCEISS